MRIISWNVNGIRAVHGKGLFLPLFKDKPDILCVQETKAQEDVFPQDLKDIKGYKFYLCSAEKKGYSGTAIWTKQEPASVKYGFGKKEFDSDGRTLIADYGKYVLYNIYFPNGGRGPKWVEYKLKFYEEFLKHAEKNRKKGKAVIACGDVNTAHKEIDLARPKENENSTGFLPEERAFLDKLVSRGYIDTFREFNREPGNYTWWDYKTGARARNIGWRIDYFFVNAELKNRLKAAFIMDKIMGSDHCPVGIEIEL
ncbi:MAG TPA: exodeoxyribonuclease III [Candidatus Goldiibacteriota bacterium]|nr:exodeoxyribonuclease III [Candidatus Goldiibacteriota bacterium]